MDTICTGYAPEALLSRRSSWSMKQVKEVNGRDISTNVYQCLSKCYKNTAGSAFLLPISLLPYFPTPYPLLPTPYPLLPTPTLPISTNVKASVTKRLLGLLSNSQHPYSQLLATYCLLPTPLLPYSPLPTPKSPLSSSYSILPTPLLPTPDSLLPTSIL